MNGTGLPRQTIHSAEQVTDLLEKNGVPSVVIGALALAAHGYVRATVDLDLAIAVDPAEMPRLARALRGAGVNVVSHETPEPQDPLGGVLNLRVPGAATIQVVNFDNSPANGFPRLVRDALASSVPMGPGTRLRAADLFSLIGFKLYAGGPKSRLDILELLDCNKSLDLAALRAWCKERRLDRELEKVLALASEP